MPMLQHDRSVLSDTRHRLYGLWDIETDSVLGYLCEPQWAFGGVLKSETEAFPESLDVGTKASIDQRTLEHALTWAEEESTVGGLLVVVVPVHFDTLLCTSSYEKFLGRIKAAIGTTVDSVYLEIILDSVTVNEIALSKRIEALSPYVMGVFLRTPVQSVTPPPLHPSAFSYLGWEARGVVQPSSHIEATLGQLAASADACGAKSYVHGLETVAMTECAAAAGISVLGSDLLVPPFEPDDAVEGDVLSNVHLRHLLSLSVR